MVKDEQGGGRANRSGSATREKIIEAAILVVAENGLGALTLQSVADRAGILYGNLTYHYPARDKLIDALIQALLERYRAQFVELARAIQANGDRSLDDIIEWLLADAVKLETGPVFIELWALANHQPAIAAAMESLYDEAVNMCIAALGVSPQAALASGLRDALYLLGSVIEGSSAIFSSRQHDTPIYRGFRREAFAMLARLLESKLAAARAQDASTAR